jgi:predicted DCC family thiol-disulfide oxidoreductase YuxK
VRLVQALDPRRRVTAVPFQQPGAAEAAGLALAECEASAWAYSVGGRRYQGAGAMNAALAVALGTRLPLWLYQAPGLRQLQDWIYRWIAANRHRLPGDSPYCEQHPERCGRTSDAP